MFGQLAKFARVFCDFACPRMSRTLVANALAFIRMLLSPRYIWLRRCTDKNESNFYRTHTHTAIQANENTNTTQSAISGSLASVQPLDDGNVRKCVAYAISCALLPNPLVCSFVYTFERKAVLFELCFLIILDRLVVEAAAMSLLPFVFILNWRLFRLRFDVDAKTQALQHTTRLDLDKNWTSWLLLLLLWWL